MYKWMYVTGPQKREDSNINKVDRSFGSITKKPTALQLCLCRRRSETFGALTSRLRTPQFSTSGYKYPKFLITGSKKSFLTDYKKRLGSSEEQNGHLRQHHHMHQLVLSYNTPIITKCMLSIGKGDQSLLYFILKFQKQLSGLSPCRSIINCQIMRQFRTVSKKIELE